MENKRKEIVGIVISDKNDKTIKAMDPAYGIVYIDNDGFKLLENDIIN